MEPTDSAALYIQDIEEEFSSYRLSYYRVREYQRPNLPTWEVFVAEFVAEFLPTDCPRFHYSLNFITKLAQAGVATGDAQALKEALVRHRFATWSEIDSYTSWSRITTYFYGAGVVQPRAPRPMQLYFNETLLVLVDIPLDAMFAALPEESIRYLSFEFRNKATNGSSSVEELAQIVQRLLVAGFTWDEIIAAQTHSIRDPAVWVLYVADTPANRERLTAQGHRVYFEPVEALFVGTSWNYIVAYDSLGKPRNTEHEELAQPQLTAFDAEGKMLGHFRNRKLKLLL